MKSIADGLPPEVVRNVHPDWRKNESGYWDSRDGLLSQYANQWVAFADGKIVASGVSPVDVYHLARQSGKHLFVTCVGREHELCRMRRVVFPYDDTYPNEALPVSRYENVPIDPMSGLN